MDIYDRLRVEKLINAAGNNTNIWGSLMAPEVFEAMMEAGRSFVDLVELSQKVGLDIARLARVEAAHVSSGAAGGVVLATAACLTGTDARRIARLPDAEGMPNEVVLRPPAGPSYIHQGIRYTGAVLRPVGTPQALSPREIEAAVTEQTAALFFIDLQDGEDLIRAGVDIARRHGVPTIVDAAAELPHPGGLSRFYDMGVDLTVFSGGKGLSGPACTGLVLGRKDLVEAARSNAPPHYAIASHSVRRMSELLGVSPSGYYAWLGRRPSACEGADRALRDRIVDIHSRSRGTYGAPRVHAEPAADGVCVGHKRVARLMRPRVPDLLPPGRRRRVYGTEWRRLR